MIPPHGYGPAGPDDPSPPHDIRALVDEVLVAEVGGHLAVIVVAVGQTRSGRLQRIALMLDTDDVTAIRECDRFVRSEASA